MKIIPSTSVFMQTSNVSIIPDTDNRDYMFDAYLNTQTEFATLIEVEIDFDNVESWYKNYIIQMKILFKPIIKSC